MSMQQRIIISSVLMLAAIAAGCGKPDPWERMPLSGQVTLDGKPLASGQLTLFPLGDIRGPAAGAEIKQGAFSIPKHEGPVVGKHRVEIRSVQKTGRQVPSPSAVEGDAVLPEGTMVEEYADVIPKRYNTYSELEIDIQADTQNQATFPLSSEVTSGDSSTAVEVKQ
jgi:hypothetical protein